MKRSEAINVIKKAMTRWNGAYYDMSIEEYILDCIEEAGMLPPYDAKRAIEANGGVLPPRPEFAFNVWEKEDG